MESFRLFNHEQDLYQLGTTCCDSHPVYTNQVKIMLQYDVKRKQVKPFTSHCLS